MGLLVERESARVAPWCVSDLSHRADRAGCRRPLFLPAHVS